MRILGGSTTSDLELTFYSEKYKITSQYTIDNILKIHLSPHDMNKTNKFSKLPFIRGLYIYISKKFTGTNLKTLKMDWLFILFIAVYILDNFFLHLSLSDYIYTSFIFFHFVVAVKNKRMIELHGAEHMIGNYYDKHNEVSLENIEEVKKHSIIHERCGSNFFGIKLTILFLSKFFIRDFMVRFAIMEALAYEIIAYRENKIVYYLSYPLYMLGMWGQKFFFVRYPKDEDIKMAITTVLVLENEEECNI